MTVKELKAILEQYDNNEEIFVIGADGKHYTTNIKVEHDGYIYIEEK